MVEAQNTSLVFMFSSLKGLVKQELLPLFNMKELFTLRSLCKHSHALLNPMHKDVTNLPMLMASIGLFEGMDFETRGKLTMLL